MASATKNGTTTPTIPTLFDRYGLGQNFSASQEEYKNKQAKAKNDPAFKQNFTYCILHHLFACSAIDTVKKYLLGKKLHEIPEILSRKDPKYGLTSLHITVILEDVAGTQELLKQGADVSPIDKYGFTPWLHTALLVEYVTLKKLLEAKGGGGSQDLWDQLRKNAGFAPDQESIKDHFFIDEKNNKEPLTLIDWSDKFHLENYTDSVVFSPSDHQHLWRLFFKHSFTENRQLFEAFSKKTSISVQLIIKASLGVNSERVNGLFLSESVTKGDFLGWYGAKTVSISPPKAEFYRWQLQQQFQKRVLEGDSKEDYFALIDDEGKVTADASSVGNVLRIANDGWPLLAIYRFPGCLGAFATQPIKANTELTYHYGISNPWLKWGYYELLNKQEMEHFLEIFDLNAMLAKIAKLKNHQFKQELILESDDLNAKLKFLFETPLAPIYLCLKKTLKASEIILLLQSSEQLCTLLGAKHPTNASHYLWLAQTLVVLQQIEQCWKNEIPPSEEKMIDRMRTFFIEEIVEQFTVVHVVKGLAILRDFSKKSSSEKIPLETNWEPFKIEMKKTLQDYVLETDSNPPLASFNKKQELTVIIEEESEELFEHLEVLKDIKGAARMTKIETKTDDWGQRYAISKFSQFFA